MKCDVVGLANRLFDVGFYTEIALGSGLPTLTVHGTRVLFRKVRVGWVPRGACVTVIPKENRRWRG